MTAKIFGLRARWIFGSQVGLVAFFGGMIGCAHWGHSSKGEPLSVETTTTGEPPKELEFKGQFGLASYKFKNSKGQIQDYSAEWLICEGKEPKGTVLITHDNKGLSDQNFCRDWLAQALISKGYGVLAVQRPGFGKSNGVDDLAGPQSIAAILAAVKEAQSKVPFPQVRGAYAYGVGAIAVGQVAKKLGSLDFMIIGGGLFDLEDTLEKTSDLDLKKNITELKKRDGDRAIEDRSIAYDVSGFPKRVAIYHGKLDKSVPPSQAKAFSDSLESSGGYRISFQLIEGVSHEVAPQTHRKIVETLLDKVSSAAP
jgi:hypothetical protein